MRQSQHIYYVYIAASRSRVLYIGVTGEIATRMRQHKAGRFNGFTKRYRVNRLVYFERFGFVDAAIQRETQLKGWRRERKIALIEEENPTWEDLSLQWEGPLKAGSSAAKRAASE